ncbi:MAG: tRNA (5-methylaminomethyl-2-thiouridine)(34)-methyltransferase MnmD, partial [Paracoccus sp. (in: a-proteobacteria)]
MTDQDQTPRLDWRDGDVPVSQQFDDPYFSLAGGLEETRHVFLAGNDLPARLRPGFQLAELGFGTGLNLFAALQAWRQTGLPGRLRYTGFEAYPLQAEEMALLRALDGRSTWGDVLNRLSREFRRHQFDESNLVAFLTSTINNALLVCSEPGQGDRLTALADRASKGRWRRLLMAAISFRWHGIDPTRLLDVTNRLVG